MTVSIGLFIIIMFIATSAFLTIVNSDRKARSVRIASDNLNIALEDMQRRIKTGSTYNCGGTAGVADCMPPTLPGTVFSFTDDNTATRYTYKQVIGNTAVPGGCGPEFVAGQGCILRSSDGGVTFMLATSPEIDIKKLNFYVLGSSPCGGTTPCTVSPPTLDAKQPVVVILIKGTVGGTSPLATSFNIQTTVTQRAYDNQ